MSTESIKTTVYNSEADESHVVELEITDDREQISLCINGDYIGGADWTYMRGIFQRALEIWPVDEDEEDQ